MCSELKYSKRTIVIILGDIITQLKLLKLSKCEESALNTNDIQIIISDKIIYLMDIINPNISPTSSLYFLYNLWLKNVKQSINLDKIIEDITNIREMFKSKL